MTDYHVLEPSTGLLSVGYLRLGVYAMQATGPAARTMAALYELADRRTRSMRVSIARIGVLCGLPRRTVQRHLHFLERQFQGVTTWRTRGASGYRISPVVWNARTKFAAMPKWWTTAPDDLQDWSTTATYAWLLSRSCLVARLSERGGTLDERLLVTLQEIAQTTGLSRRSVSDALGMLEEFGLIRKSAPTPTHPTFQFEMRPVRVPRSAVSPAGRLRVDSNEKRRI
ncbi:MAG TPA: hypothetical protein VMR25_00600 [Planctomycetaceae bacterium]|nr:hypothetical protein [Planctomycetaceae bacterium]